MRNMLYLCLCLVLIMAIAGCASTKAPKIKTYLYDVERVDQDLAAGNRGVLMGTPPPVEERGTLTREMMGIDIELPSSDEYLARKEQAGTVVPEEAPYDKGESRVFEVGAETSVPEIVVEEAAVVEEPVQVLPLQPEMPVADIGPVTYTVQKGDTLEKISKRFLGKASRWQEIYDANRDRLSAPNRIYPGQVLIIPQAAAGLPEGGADFK